MAPPERLTCPACGGALTPWRSLPGGEPADRSRYGVLRCASCGTGVTAGAPPPPSAYESGQYTARPPRARRLLEPLQRAVAGQALAFLRRRGLRAGGRVLDVGAGQGRMVETLAAGGYEARGIDPSRRSVELARAAGRDVELRAVAEHADADLDAAIVWHVLEHLDGAPAAVEAIHGWLRPGGLLLVGVPNVASWQARIAGDGWLHWDLPRHRLHFTADGVARLLQQSGFEILRTHHFVLEQNVLSMWMALLTRLGVSPGFPFHFLKRNIDARARDMTLTAFGLPLLPVALALELLAALARHGGTVAVVARRV